MKKSAMAWAEFGALVIFRFALPVVSASANGKMALFRVLGWTFPDSESRLWWMSVFIDVLIFPTICLAWIRPRLDRFKNFRKFLIGMTACGLTAIAIRETGLSSSRDGGEGLLLLVCFPTAVALQIFVSLFANRRKTKSPLSSA